MHIGVELAQLIRTREGIMNLLQEFPDLSDEERAVAAGDGDTLNRLIEKYKDVSPPPVPNERYIFNPSALAFSYGKPLRVLAAHEKNSTLSSVTVSMAPTLDK